MTCSTSNTSTLRKCHLTMGTPNYCTDSYTSYVPLHDAYVGYSNYPSIYTYVYHKVSFLQIFCLKFCMNFSPFPCMQHCLPIFSSLTWSSYKYLKKHTSYEAPHCAVSSNLPSLPLPQVLISSAPCSQTCSTQVLSLG